MSIFCWNKLHQVMTDGTHSKESPLPNLPGIRAPPSLIKTKAPAEPFLCTASVNIQVNPTRDYLCQLRLTSHVISSQVR